MTRKPRLLDLYCCEGGAGMGYSRAGFEVVGVDIKPQARYPFAFHQGDVLAVVAALLSGRRIKFTRPAGSTEELGLADLDAIHASPPCQFATELNNDKSKHDNLIPATRALLQKSGRPYLIENVEGAKPHLFAPLMLCGTMFGLGSGDAELRRHRLFETSWSILFVPECRHIRRRVIGVYGGHGRDRRRRQNTQDFTVEQRREAMGMDWARGHGLSQAIPPAYTEWLGKELRAHLEHLARAA